MKEKWNGIQLLGLFLVLLSIVFLLGSEWLAARNHAEAVQLAEQIEANLPDRSEGDPENYSDPEMPVLQIGGEDFSGLIQIPFYGVSLPIYSSWDSGAVSRYPCRFWGSVYDNSLIVGGGKGQFDFCGKLDLGDKVIITDMKGTVFSYETVRIDRREHADLEMLEEEEFDLVLFAPDTVADGYIIVRCAFSP